MNKKGRKDEYMVVGIRKDEGRGEGGREEDEERIKKEKDK
jgi:hypothetical protein